MRRFYALLLFFSCLALLSAASCTAPFLNLPVPAPVILEPSAAATDAPSLTPAEAPTAPPTMAVTPVLPARLSVPTLMYHHVQVLGRKNNTATWRNITVTPKDFDDQMAYLVSHNYHTISFADLTAAFNEGRSIPQNPIIITFDDAWAEQYAVAYPILRKYGLTATFFVPTSFMDHVKGALKWEQIQEMNRNGMEFGSHSVTHPFLTKQKLATVKWELETSKAALEEHLGKQIVAFSYPFGAYNASVISQVKDAGYQTAVTVKPGLWAVKGDLLTLHRTGIPYGLGLQAFERVLQSLAAKEAPPATTPEAMEATPVVTPGDMEAMPATPQGDAPVTPGVISATPELMSTGTPGR